MAMVISRHDIIKEREGARIRRLLRVLFGGKTFGFDWSTIETSYTDGNTIWIKYDVQTPHHRTFTEAECRILRIAHSIHERGHIEFDYLPDYKDWLIENTSNRLSDWKTNSKYPKNFTEFFGNMSLDGRMENLTVIKLPEYKKYIDFCNLEWRYGIRGSHNGTDKVWDFQDCYASRVLGMDDLDNWLEESVELVNGVMEEINELRAVSSTKECLTLVSTIIKKVWPTLLEWLDIDEEKIKKSTYESNSYIHIEAEKWGEKDETEENAKKTILIVSSSKEEEGEDGDMSDLMKIHDSNLSKDEQEAESIAAPFDKRSEAVEVNLPHLNKKLNEDVQILPYPTHDLVAYNKNMSVIKRHIKPTAKVLKDLLEGTPDQIRRNVRSGRFMPNKAWKGVHCEDTNIYQKSRKGTPSTNAFISLMADISGSTGCSLKNGNHVIQEIKSALQLLLEACHEANIPSNAYAFTEDEDTIIYPVKPSPHRFTDVEKGYMGALRPQLGNRDTFALKWSITQMQKRTESIRLLVMLSDGIPCFEHGENPATMAHMVKEAEKEGIDVLCLFVGNPSAQEMKMVREMYPGRSIFANGNIARELQKHVQRIIRQRR